MLAAYTDGSCLVHSPGSPGGWAAVFSDGCSVLGSDAKASTASRMELMAVLGAIKHSQAGIALEVFTDCTYVVHGVQRLRQTGCVEPTQDSDLWQELKRSPEERDIIVKQHLAADKHPLHIRAHNLAYQSAQKLLPQTEPVGTGELRALRLIVQQQKATLVVVDDKGVHMNASNHYILTARPTLGAIFHSNDLKSQQVVLAKTHTQLSEYLEQMEVRGWRQTGKLQWPNPITPVGMEQSANQVQNALDTLRSAGFQIGDLQRQVQQLEAFCTKVDSLIQQTGWKRIGQHQVIAHLPYRLGEVQITLIGDPAAGALRPWKVHLIDAFHAQISPVSVTCLGNGLRQRLRNTLRAVKLDLQCDAVKVTRDAIFGQRLEEAMTARYMEWLHAFKRRLATCTPGTQAILVRQTNGEWQYRWVDTDQKQSAWLLIPTGLVSQILVLIRQHLEWVQNRWAAETGHYEVAVTSEEHG